MKHNISAVIIFSIIVFILAGCSQQGGDSRKTRLLAAENLTLEKEIQNRDAEIANRDAQIAALNKQLDQQKDSLAKCQQANKDWENELNSKLQERVGDMSRNLMEQIQQLRQENEALKAKLPQSSQ